MRGVRNNQKGTTRSREGQVGLYPVVAAPILFGVTRCVLVVFALGVIGATTTGLAADGDLPLVSAVRSGDLAAVRPLLASGVDVNAGEPDGTTALHWAAFNDDVETVRELLRAGAAVGAVNRYGVAPLSLACINGTAAVVAALLEAGADARTALPEGETALMTAARSGNAEVLRLLITHGADVNAREQFRGQTALMWAASYGHAAAVRVLLEYGADVNARSKGSPTAAGLRREGAGAPVVVKQLPTGYSAILFAARAGRIEVAQALLDAGASLADVAPDASTPLMLAIINAHFELAAMLLDRGADANFVGRGWMPLHATLEVRNPDQERFVDPVPTGRLTSFDLLRSLLAHGADPNGRSVKRLQGMVGATPFALAAKAGDTDAMRLLAAHGADPLLAANDGTTPLMVAAGIGFREGASPATDADALAGATLCIELGGDVNAMNNAGDTALHGAASRGADAVVRLLVAKGARIAVKNKKGITPIQATEAAEGKTAHPGTAALLRDLLAQAASVPPR